MRAPGKASRMACHERDVSPPPPSGPPSRVRPVLLDRRRAAGADGEGPADARRGLQHPAEARDQVARGVLVGFQLDPAGGVGHQPQAGFHPSISSFMSRVSSTSATTLSHVGYRARSGPGARCTAVRAPEATGPEVALVGSVLRATGAEGAAPAVSGALTHRGGGRRLGQLLHQIAGARQPPPHESGGSPHISAAIIALGARRTSSSALSSICHIRVSARMGSRADRSCPRARSPRADGRSRRRRRA